MSKPWLSTQRFDAVYQAQLVLGQGETAEFAILRGALAPAFRASIGTDGSPNLRLLQALQRLNEVRNLTNGDIPLEQWLRQAVTIAGLRPERRVLEEALSIFVPEGGAVPPPAASPLTPADTAGLELQLGTERQTVDVAYLRRALQAATSVARLLVPRFFSGVQQLAPQGTPEFSRGTGWLVTPSLLVTNHHVLRARFGGETPPDAGDLERQARKTVVEFEYFDDVHAPVRRSVAELVAADATIDFAVVRLTDDATVPRLPLRLSQAGIRQSRGVRLSRRVNLLQHPGGEPMRLGFRDNFVVEASAAILSYLTDTEAGSSGSPVTDDGWQVYALHRGFQRLEQPIVVRDHEIRYENYGIPIERILAHLAREHPEVHDEIQAAQGHA